MSRITSGQMLLATQAIAFESVLDFAIEALRPAAEAKHIHLIKQCEAGAGPVAGDPGRLRQVCWNLLSNALKLRQAEAQFELTISDSGIGRGASFTVLLPVAAAPPH